VASIPKRILRIFNCTLSGKALKPLKVKAKDVETQVYSCKENMNCRYWIMTITKPTPMGKLEVSTNKVRRLLKLENLKVAGILMMSSIQLLNSTKMAI